jgi:8-amino-7-oxononanoate synthase
MNALQLRLRRQLEESRQSDLYRQRLVLEGAQGPEVTVYGIPMLSFCSNDYLGLANHPDLVAGMQQAAATYGVGSGASHLVSGHSEVHQELEEALAEFTGRSRALLFSSGYMANIGVLNTLLQKGDYVFEDRLNHASLLDGGLSSGARFRRFPHSNAEQLAYLLQGSPEEAVRLVVVDGVFSMDGDSAPLGSLARVCNQQRASLMVDDAHGFGVLGATGAGSLEEVGLEEKDVPVLMATLGTALGCAGAFVAGSEDLIETLIQFSRTYIHSTAMPPAIAAASLTALRVMQAESWRRSYLHLLVTRFRMGAGQLGLPLMDSSTAIQPILLGEAGRAPDFSERLRQQNILVSAIRPPTVPEESARLRITLSAAHKEEHIDRLLDALDKASQ